MSSQGADAHRPESRNSIRGNPANLPGRLATVKLTSRFIFVQLLTVILHNLTVARRLKHRSSLGKVSAGPLPPATCRSCGSQRVEQNIREAARPCQIAALYLDRARFVPGRRTGVSASVVTAATCGARFSAAAATAALVVFPAKNTRQTFFSGRTRPPSGHRAPGARRPQVGGGSPRPTLPANVRWAAGPGAASLRVSAREAPGCLGAILSARRGLRRARTRTRGRSRSRAGG